MSLLGDINRRRGVQVYAPQLPARPMPGAAPAPRVAAPPTTGSLLSQLGAAARASQVQQQEEEGDSGFWDGFGDRLGFVVNNPITETALKGIGALGYIGAAGAATVKEGLDVIGPGLDAIFTQIPGVQGREDLRRTNPNYVDPYDGGFDLDDLWQNIKDRKGFGELIVEPAMGEGGTDRNIWTRRIAGLGGDIATDPLSAVAGIGFAARGAGVGSRAGRANLAVKALDGVPQAERATRLAAIQKLTQEGVGAADRELLEQLGVKGGIRLGTRRNNITVLEGLTRPLSRARGAASELIGSTRVGRALQNIRTPDELEDAYARLFYGQGPLDTEAAVTRVRLANASRRGQAGFQNQAVRQLRKTMRQVRGLSGDAKRQLLLDTERGGQRTVLNEAMDYMHQAAEEAGLPIGYIQNYAPHILTRDAQKFVRGTDDSARQFMDALGMHTEELFDPSGVTMTRRIKPGDYEINGIPISLKEGTVEEVNAAFRRAGLKFDFYESDPSVILEKYINMVSSDVGFSRAFREAAERDPEGMIRMLTPQQLDAMADQEGFGGVAALVPDGRVPQRSDLDVIAQKAETTLPDDLFTPVPAQGKTVTVTKRGKIKEIDYSKTDRYNASMATKLNNERNIAFAEREALLTRADEVVGGARQTVLDELESVRQGAIKTAREQRDIVKRTLRQIEEGRASRDQMVEWIDQIDSAVRAFDDDIRFMDEALARDLDRNSRRYIGQEMRELRAERARLIERSQKLAQSVKGDEVLANYFRQKADGLADILYAEVRAAQDDLDRMVSKQLPGPKAPARETDSAFDPKYLTDRDAERLAASKQLLAGSTHRRYATLRDAKAAGQKLSKEDAAWLKGQEGGALAKSVEHHEDIVKKLSAKEKRIVEGGVNRAESPLVKAARRRLEEAQLRAERLPTQSDIAAGNLNPNLQTRVGSDPQFGKMSLQAPTSGGMADELSQVRQASNRVSYERNAEMESALGRVSEIDEQLASFKDPEFRQTAVDKRSVAGAQAKPRMAAEAARSAAVPWVLNPRRKEYIKRIAQIDEAEGALIERMDEAASGALDQAALRADSEALLRRVNINTPETPIKRPTSRKPSTEAISEVEARAAELRTTLGLGEDVLPTEVAAQVEVMLNDALKAVMELPAADESLEAVSKALTKAKQGSLGRVVSAKLDAAWKQGGGDRLSAVLGEDVVVHQQVMQSLQRVRDNVARKEFWPILDTFTNLFKTYAVMTPGFHVRNAMSAMFMNSADGVTLASQAEGARLFASFMRSKDPGQWLATKGQQVLNKETGLTVADAFDAAWGSGIGGRYFERGVGDRASLRYKALEKAFDNPLTRFSRGAGGGVEGLARLPMALDSIRMGASVDDALERITRIHFDYSQVSRFDERAKRLIPFWTFMSRNLPLQVSMMWTNPKRYAQYYHFVRNFSVPDEEGTPEYFGDTGAFNTGMKLGGLPMYLQPDLPFTRLNEEVEKVENVLAEGDPRLLSDFNPMFTAPVEFVTGQDIYTGRQLDETDVRQTGTLEKPIELLGRLLNAGETAPTGERFTQERLINLVRALVPVYDRGVRLAPGGVTGGTSEDAQARQMESWLRFLGAPVRQLSPQQQQATLNSERYENLDQKRVMNAMLRMLREQQAQNAQGPLPAN